MSYQPLDREVVLRHAAQHHLLRPLTTTGRLTSEGLRSGLDEVVYEGTLSHRHVAGYGKDCFVRLSSNGDNYDVTTGQPGATLTVTVERLNRARQIFHAFAFAFVTGDPQVEADAFALLEVHDPREGV
jgi:hypothetical protein